MDLHTHRSLFTARRIDPYISLINMKPGRLQPGSKTDDSAIARGGIPAQAISVRGGLMD